MNEDLFWQIIKTACMGDPHQVDDWHQGLVERLIQLPASQIIEWNHIFDRMVAAAFTCDLIATCVMINCGAGDDGFYYFRCWLVGMGKDVYSAAIALSG